MRLRLHGDGLIDHARKETSAIPDSRRSRVPHQPGMDLLSDRWGLGDGPFDERSMAVGVIKQHGISRVPSWLVEPPSGKRVAMEHVPQGMPERFRLQGFPGRNGA